MEPAGGNVLPAGAGAPASPIIIRERAAGIYAGPPLAAISSPDDVQFSVAVEIADLHIDPSHGRGPVGPETGGEGGAGGQTAPPLPGLQDASGNVRFAVAVEIADLDIDPGHRRTPGRPMRIDEGRTGGLRFP